MVQIPNQKHLQMGRVKPNPNPTVKDMQSPVVLDDLTPLWKLELVMLGALIANKQLRKEVAATDFTDGEIAQAVEDLQGKGVGFIALKQVMRSLQVNWIGSGTPLDAMVKRLKLNGQYNQALSELTGLFAGTSGGEDEALQGVIDAAKRIGGKNGTQG